VAGDIFNLHVQGLNDTDRALAQRILDSLQTDTALAAMLPSVNILVSGGRVVLQGQVQTGQQKQTIDSVVRQAAGPSPVEDQLQMMNPLPTANP
jgi:osmotically-inducible protein OsmY